MTNAYTWVAWNRHKKIYDAVALAAVTLFVVVHLGVTFAAAETAPDPAVALIRAFGSAAIVLLHVVLIIGPLSRLTDKALPLLYNRRHLGVLTFLVAAAHAGLATLYYGAFGPNPIPIEQMLFAGRDFGSIEAFPFELLGFLALLWLFVMAATSHDYWLANLSPGVWKALHMGVYLAYALLIGHVALGSMRDDATPVTVALLAAGVLLVGGLHAAAGLRELARDSAAKPTAADGWVRACAVRDVPEGRAVVVPIAGRERVAVFRSGGKLSAVTNVCAHQQGPLGEGAIVDGCITCPWHGYQYRPDDGTSPPPYSEKIATYNLRVEGEDVLIDPRPNPPGTRVEPAVVPAAIDPTGPLFEDPAPRKGAAAP